MAGVVDAHAGDLRESRVGRPLGARQQQIEEQLAEVLAASRNGGGFEIDQPVCGDEVAVRPAHAARAFSEPRIEPQGASSVQLVPRRDAH